MPEGGLRSIRHVRTVFRTTRLASSVLCLVSTTLGLLAIIGPRLSPWWFALASAAPLHGALFVLSGAVSALQRRWHLLRIVLVVGGVWFSLGLDATLSARAHAAASLDGAVTIVSANLMASNTSILDVAEQLLAQDPDVIVTIETSTDAQLVLDQALVGYERAAVETAARWVPDDYVVIWTRLEHIRRSAIVVADRVLPVVDVETSAGAVRVIGVHLSSPTSDEYVERLEREYAELASVEIGTGAVVLIGDFNTSVWSPALRDLNIDGRRFHSAERVRGSMFAPSWPSLRTSRSFGLGFPLLDLDHAMVTGVDVGASSTFAVAGSDHRGVRVELSPAR